LYFFKQKRLLLLFLGFAWFMSLYAQEQRPVGDTLSQAAETIAAPGDSITYVAGTSSGLPLRSNAINALENQVIYTSDGYIKRDLINRKVFLVSSAKVNYGKLEITADSIVINMNTNTLYAFGRKDTSGSMKGNPVFKEGSQEIKADSLRYNFRTKRALASNIETMQEEGLLRSQVTKLLEDGTSNIARSTYSTCDADHPHFFINLPKAKVYPGKKIVSGPGNLVLEGIPLPLFLPFGYFPIQTKKAASGILMPRIGQENARGYSLTDGGYYFAVSDYFDLSLRGNVYTNGSWMATAQTNYRKLYRYSGNFSFSYANNISGHRGLPDYSKSNNYRIGWNYTQDAKAAPGSRLGASVNMSSSGFDRNNSYVVTEHVTTQRQSSVSYSKTWEGTPFNFSASMNHSQDVRRKTVNLNLPKANFNMSRIFPLKSRNSFGPSKWWQDLQFSYSAALDNQISTLDSLLFTNQVWKNMRNGFKHEAPLSLQLRPFKNFSISPSLTYTGVLYTQKVEQFWDPDFINTETGRRGAIIRDTISGITYGHAVNPAISASFNPQIFGMYQFTNPNSRVQAVRHVIKPSVSFSFIPSLAGLSSKMYRQVQVDTTGRFGEYSIYDRSVFGTPSLARKNGNIAFSLVNLVEAKMFSRNDTTGKARKVRIIDNFAVNTSYNIFADSMRWAPVSMGARTTLANNINISANSSFSLYGVNSSGRPVGTFAMVQNGKLMRLTNVGTSIDLNVSDLFKGKTQDQGRPSSTPNALTGGIQTDNPTGVEDLSQRNSGSGFTDEYGYPKFDVPWTMNLSYSISYSKAGLTSMISQTMTMSGNVSITPKMQMTYTTGYDFRGKEITMTQIGISRDLHCWEMNFNWVPNGTMKMWNFTIRVKASVLGDLKYERRKDFHDNF
jgi:lipopolysaccharide export system protein LptA